MTGKGFGGHPYGSYWRKQFVPSAIKFVSQTLNLGFISEAIKRGFESRAIV